jgi:methionyl-tRNA synthetase
VDNQNPAPNNENESPAPETASAPAADIPNEQVAEPAAEPKKETKQQISIGKFMNVDLRVAIVKVAEPIEGADKLLRLEVDLGDETRQIVAGIAKAYEPQELVGRRIIVVANLKPVTLRGVESQGMLLAADLDGAPTLATFEGDVPPGTPVH